MLEFLRTPSTGPSLSSLRGRSRLLRLDVRSNMSIGRCPTQTARQQEALRNVFYARFVTYGMVVSGLAWWVIKG